MVKRKKMKAKRVVMKMNIEGKRGRRPKKRDG